MKAILVIDMPTHCGECPVKCRMRGINHVPTWCPLRPLPQKYNNGVEYDIEPHSNAHDYLEVGIKMGWDACLEEITGRKEDCRDCQEWESCPSGKIGHDKGTSIGYSIGECKHYKKKQNEGNISD